MKVGGQFFNEPATLIARVVENQRDRHFEMKRFEFSQQLTNAFGIDVRIVRHGDHLQVNWIDGAQHIEALAAARRFDPDAGETPQETQKCAEHEVGRIHKKHGALTRFGLF